jgi:uncharacterized LabA/DUF88 family protein
MSGVLMPTEPAVKNVMGFVDGQNLFRHAKDAFGHYHPNYDPIKLLKAICAARGWRDTLVHFYTGVPLLKDDKPWSEYWSKRVIALKRANVQVTTRPLRYRYQMIVGPDGKPQEVSTAQEKGIDVRLALDIVKLARKKQYDVAVVFSQDQDLAEIVEEIREISLEQDRWIKIVCAYPVGPNATYGRGIPGTDWFGMDQTFYDACLDPRDYRPA